MSRVLNCKTALLATGKQIPWPSLIFVVLVAVVLLILVVVVAVAVAAAAAQRA